MNGVQPLRRRLLGLPVDARPVVRAQVQQLVASAGWELLLPPVSALGHFRVPADRDALWRWVQQQAGAVDGLVLSLDMLVYGGLVPSRFIADPLAVLLARLHKLRELRARHPGTRLTAFLATMRLSNNNIADEEKPYWAEHGTQLWQWSFHSDRAAVLRAAGGPQADALGSEALAAAVAARLPEPVRLDYRSTRERNFAVASAALLLVQGGVIHRLVLPQDDTAAFGFNIAERRALQAQVQALALQDRVLIYPGADEVMHTLCAHTLRHLQNTPPLRVALAFSDPSHVAALQALYEDRPLLESVASQIAAVGAQALPAGVTSAGAHDAQADVLLAVHTQGTEQGDWAMGRPLPQRPGVDAAWWQRLHAAHARGQPVSLVDLAFANGGDPWLLARIDQPDRGAADTLPPLFTYAGWNTASNSLGGALAHLALAHAAQPQTPWHSPKHRHICALRLFEDGCYQAVLRQALRGCVHEAGCDATTLERQAQELVPVWANAWAAGIGLPWRVQQLWLPWGRTFEIGLQLQPAP